VNHVLQSHEHADVVVSTAADRNESQVYDEDYERARAQRT